MKKAQCLVAATGADDCHLPMLIFFCGEVLVDLDNAAVAGALVTAVVDEAAWRGLSMVPV